VNGQEPVAGWHSCVLACFESESLIGNAFASCHTLPRLQGEVKKLLEQAEKVYKDEDTRLRAGPVWG
jgi:hypothetical protein